MPQATEQKPKANINDQELIAEICGEISAGKSIRSVTKPLGVAFERAFWRRMAADKEFVIIIARAREAGQDALTDEMLDIADEATEKNVNSAKLRIWARQWHAGKVAARKYGDKLGLGAAEGLDSLTIRVLPPQAATDVTAIETRETDQRLT